MKRIQDTSRAAYREWLPQRAKQESMVLAALAAYCWQHGASPTGRELLAFVQRQHPDLDVNGVRPNLTRLEDSGEVAKGPKRQCSITAKLVYTWQVIRPRPVPRVQEPPPGGQGSFFATEHGQ